MAHHPINLDTFQPLMQITKAISHPVRLAILEILRDGEHCVCHMEAVLGYRQAYISQQLMVLREAGLITDTRNGWNIYYRVADRRIYAVIDALEQFRDPAAKPLILTHVKNCPCPKCNANQIESQ